jgi:hypothetical protein
MTSGGTQQVTMMQTPALNGIDVGSPRLHGSTTQSAHDTTILAGGEDIWGMRDEFHFAHVPVAGSFELRVRVVSLEMADVYTKAGLMLRSSLEAGAEHAFLLAFGDNQPRNRNNGGLEFQYRETPDGPCTGIYPPQPLPPQPDFPVRFPEVWLKLVRQGDTITGQASQDGERWRTFCVHQQRLPHAAFLGLAVTSHNASQTVKAVFSQLELRPGA